MKIAFNWLPGSCCFGVRYQEGERVVYNGSPTAKVFDLEYAEITDRCVKEAQEEGWDMDRYYAIDIWVVLPLLEIGFINLNRGGWR